MKLNSRSLGPNSIDKNPAEIPCTGHHKKWVVETGLRIKVVSLLNYPQVFFAWCQNHLIHYLQGQGRIRYPNGNLMEGTWTGGRRELPHFYTFYINIRFKQAF